jgi:transcriptional regulator with XRE-family HTH domain
LILEYRRFIFIQDVLPVEFIRKLRKVDPMSGEGWGDELPDWTRQERLHFAGRLSKELKRAGVSQQIFVDVLRERHGIAMSLRTLTNYLTGATRPTTAWIRAAARVLGVRPEWLLSGKEPRAKFRGGGISYHYVPRQPEVAGEWDAQDTRGDLIDAVENLFIDLPIGARWAMSFFMIDYYGDRFEVEREEAERVILRFFSQLRTVASELSYSEAIAAAHSLVAAAYLTTGLKGEDHA